MNKFIENLKRQAEENPIGALIVTALVVTAASKFVDAAGHAAGSRAYARQIDHKIRTTR